MVMCGYSIYKHFRTPTFFYTRHVYYICITLSKKIKRIQNCVTSKSNFNPNKGSVTSNLAPFSMLPPLDAGFEEEGCIS